MKYVFLFLAVSLSSCKETPSQPLEKVELAVNISPNTASPLHPAAITIDAVNNGTTTIYRIGGCGFWPVGFPFTVLDPDSNAVSLFDPKSPRPLCADGPMQFLPGQKLSGAATFSGKLFDKSGNQYAARNGTYTVVVKLDVSPDEHFQNHIVIERRISFQWIAE